MPIVPPAPVRFSMTICWPIARVIASPTTRATKSSPPPGASGTMKRTGRLGHSSDAGVGCARVVLGESRTGATPPSNASPPAAVRVMNVRRSIFDNIRSPCWLLVSRRRAGERIADAARAKSADWRQTAAAPPGCALQRKSRARLSGDVQANVKESFRPCSGSAWNISVNAYVDHYPSTTDGADVMRKTLTALAAAATVAVATVATPSNAEARWGWWGPALGAFAVGAIVGSAFARPYYYGGYYGGYYPAYSYYPSYSYGYAPAYYGYAYSPGPYYGCVRYRYGYRYRVC